MPVRAILFDIDGTLADSNDDHVRAWDEAFRAAGHRFDARVIHDQIGKGTDNLVPTLLPGITEADAEALGDAHGRIFKDRYLPHVKPFPGAHDLLARVHAEGARIVLASSASAGELDHYLGLLDARGLTTATTSSDDVAHTKPAPDIFATALARIGKPDPATVLVIGDTPYDIDAARKCGVRAVAVRSGGFTDAMLTEAGAIAIYDDVAALLAGYADSPLAA